MKTFNRIAGRARRLPFATSPGHGIASRPTSLLHACLLFALGAGGCVQSYPPAPVYGGSAYVAPTSVAVEVGDRAYYTRGPGYWVGRSYYVWRPGHWTVRDGRRVWVHGHYVLRG